MNQSQKRYLFVPTPGIKTDTFLTLHALSNTLIKNGHAVEMLVKDKSLEEFKKKLALPESIKTLEKLPEQKVLLQFPGQKSSVKGIQWNQDKDQLNLYVSMQNGQFNAEDMKLIRLSEDYTQVVILGVDSLDQIPEFNDPKFKYIFEKVEMVSLGTDLKGEAKNLKNIFDKDHISSAEDALSYVDKNSLKFEQGEANTLLSAIFFKSGNFKLDLKSAKTFENCAKLLKLGATNTGAQKILSTLKA